MPTVDYTLGPDVDPRLRQHDSAGNASYHVDALGSTVALTDTPGTGRPPSVHPAGPSAQTHLRRPRWPHHPLPLHRRPADPNGLIYLRARYYQPQWNRFLAEDPLGVAAGPNPYEYVSGNPLDAADPRAPTRCSRRVPSAPSAARRSSSSRTTRPPGVTSQSAAMGCLFDLATAGASRLLQRALTPSALPANLQGGAADVQVYYGEQRQERVCGNHERSWSSSGRARVEVRARSDHLVTGDERAGPGDRGGVDRPKPGFPERATQHQPETLVVPGCCRLGRSLAPRQRVVAMGDVLTNLRVLKPSCKKPRAGDLFGAAAR